MKKSYKNNRFKISAPTVDIQDHFKYILKKHGRKHSQSFNNNIHK